MIYIKEKIYFLFDDTNEDELTFQSHTFSTLKTEGIDIKNINLEFINLRKRNVFKFIEKIKNLNDKYIIYVHEDRKEIIEKMKEENIKYVIYGYKQSKIISQLSNERNYGSDFVGENIIERVDNECKRITLYSTNWCTYTIEEFEIPFRKLKFYSQKNNVFENYENAKEYLTKYLKNKIENMKISIENSEKRILWKRNELKEEEIVLEKMKNGSWSY